MLARLTTVVALVVAGFVPATASASSSTICVGLVVDSRSIGGSVSDTCVNVKPGTTGVGVLEAAGHSVTFRHDGLLCTIDGVPNSGCSEVDDTHYWAYFHRAPDSTSWHYSNENMSTYQPANRSTEGWVYDDGSALRPENIPASKICAGLVKPTPTPTSTPTKPDHATTRTHPPVASPSAATSPRSSQTPKPATTGRARHHRSPGAATSPPDSIATQSTRPTASPTAVATDTSSSGHGNATGVLVAAGVIAVIAAATAIGARRRR